MFLIRFIISLIKWSLIIIGICALLKPRRTANTIIKGKAIAKTYMETPDEIPLSELQR